MLPMMRSRRLAALTTCAALAGGGLLAGCGEDEGSKPPPPSASVDAGQAFAAAADKTAKASSYKLTSSSKISLAGKSIDLTFDGAADLAAKRTEAELDFSKLGQELGGDQIDQVGGPDALKGELVTDLSGGGLKAYVKMPALNALFAKLGATGLPAYGVLDFAKLGTIGGIDLSALVSASQSADQSTALLRQLAGTPKAVGQEDVRGVPTTRYEATVDFTKTAPGADPAVQKALKAVGQAAVQQGGSAKVPVQVWLDGDGYLRKQSYRQGLPGGGSSTTSIELYDFDEPVDVQVPAAGQTWDVLSELEKVQPGFLATLQQAATAGVTP